MVFPYFFTANDHTWREQSKPNATIFIRNGFLNINGLIGTVIYLNCMCVYYYVFEHKRNAEHIIYMLHTQTTRTVHTIENSKPSIQTEHIKPNNNKRKKKQHTKSNEQIKLQARKYYYTCECV